MRVHPSYTVNGEPIIGSYAVRSLEGLKACRKVGMNTIIGTHEMVDVATETGTFIQETGLKVMHHMTKFLYGLPTLGDLVGPDQDEVPLSTRPARELESPGIVQVDDELIRYQEFTKEALRGCKRGYRGTEPAEHHEGIILFQPEECAREVKAVRKSPNLLGFYVLDDSPGDALSALKAMYRTIWSIDGGQEHHPVFAGYGSKGSLSNFAPGVCDVMMIYWYPVGRNGYNRGMISSEVQWMMMEARKRVPGMPFIGVYQTYWGDGAVEPSPAQVREQMEDFVREGASGLIAFACEVGEPLGGWLESQPIQEELTRTHEEIRRTGGLQASPEPGEMARSRIQPTGFWDLPRELPGLVPAWHVIGPFDDLGKELLKAEFPPESELDLDATYQGKFGPAHWIRRESVSGSIGLGEIFGVQSMTSYCVAYATCTVRNPRERDVLMKAGSDDEIVVWLGGEECWRHTGTRGLERDDDVIRVCLPEGESRLLLKVANMTGMWGFFLRFTDVDGRPLTDLEFLP